ncbi:MAG TPA: tRNA pseudouridine(38-40) synthase TruA [Acidimicrobiia bacterium]
MAATQPAPTGGEAEATSLVGAQADQLELAPPPSPQRLRLVVAYDGTSFRGFAAQRDLRTVEGVLASALEKALRAPIEDLNLACAGRTDAGVHAWGQVVSVDAPRDADPKRVRHALNRMLAPEVVVRSLEWTPSDFDARRSARWRTYRYTIVNTPTPDPFLARFAWWVPEPLDLAQLRLAADPFVGEHDFAAFCRKGPAGSSTVRVVHASRWMETTVADRTDVLVYEVTASAFCWQMVRAIVGTIVEAGAGRRRPGDLLRILRGGDRNDAGQLAPPQGLCLWAVGYDP